MQLVQNAFIFIALASLPHAAADDEMRCFVECFRKHAAEGKAEKLETVRDFMYPSISSRRKRSDTSDELKGRQLFKETPTENICDPVGTDYAIATCFRTCPHGAHRPLVEQYAKTLAKYCDPSTEASEPEKFWTDGAKALKSIASYYISCPRDAFAHHLSEGPSSVCKNYTSCMEEAASSREDQFDFDVMVFITDSFRLESSLMFYRETQESCPMIFEQYSPLKRPGIVGTAAATRAFDLLVFLALIFVCT